RRPLQPDRGRWQATSLHRCLALLRHLAPQRHRLGVRPDRHQRDRHRRRRQAAVLRRGASRDRLSLPMGDIVNLNRAKKARAKADKAALAAENRVRFGRSKAEKTKAAAEKTIAE